MKNLVKNFTIIFLVLLTFAAILSFSYSGKVEPEKVGVNRLIQNINDERVKEVEVRGDFLLATLFDEETVLEVKKEPGQSFAELMSDYGVESSKLQKVNLLVKEESGLTYWMTLILPAMLPILLIIGIIWFMSRQMQGMNNKAMGFGQSQAKQNKPDDKSKKTFKDVAGAKEAKEELNEVLDFLKNPKKFTEMGAKIPKGLLLMGSPGTGKTLLAKAVAGEADVPFFHISGSEFVEMFVGVGASRVRDLFNKAKKAAPAIIFIDEIDAVARKRGAGLGGSHDEREQTLNQILVEMDGFDPNLGVIVIAATNRPDVLDPALLRPGRFDRRVVIDMPDIEDREQILHVHAKGKPLTKEVSIRKVAERTPGFSGADLANLLNEAAILAVRLGKKKIDEKEVLESIEKVMLGPEKKSRVISDQEREMTAYHEAGHAVVGHFLKNCDSIRKVSIVGRGMAGGYTLNMPEKDKRYKTLSQFKDDMAMTLGGYVIEKMKYGEDNLTTGPSSDLKQITNLARSMITRYGMSDKLGARTFGKSEDTVFLGSEVHEQRDYSETTADVIDKEIKELIVEAEKRAEKVITEKKEELEKLVEVLLVKETLEQKEIKEILG